MSVYCDVDCFAVLCNILGNKTWEIRCPISVYILMLAGSQWVRLGGGSQILQVEAEMRKVATQGVTTLANNTGIAMELISFVFFSIDLNAIQINENWSRILPPNLSFSLPNMWASNIFFSVCALVQVI